MQIDFSDSGKYENALCNVGETAGEDDSYCRKAYRLGMRVNEFSVDCDKYIAGSFTLDSDGLFTRLVNTVGDKMVVIGRASCLSSLRGLKRECEDYFARHSYLFEKANEILRSNNLPEIDSNVPPTDINLNLDNAISNENWSMDIGELCEKVNAYICKTAEIASEMSAKLDSLTDEPADAAQALPQSC